MGGASALVFYIIPGLLGRGYNINTDTVGADLFDATIVKRDAKVIDKYVTTSEYKLVEDLEEAKDFLDVSGKLALKLKTGNINVEGAGSYLKQATSFHNKIELLFKVYYETKTFTIPSHVQPLNNWKQFKDRTHDTHYIRSITYGGHLIASVSFMANSKADLEHIKGSINAEMSSKSGSFGGSVKGKLEKIANATTDSSSITVNYFATVPLKDIPRDIDGLVKLVQSFPDQTKEVNGGIGVPVQMEVFSLEGIDKSVSTNYQTVAFTNHVVMLEEQFADLRATRRRLNDWMHTIPPRLSTAAKEKITKFNNNLEQATKVFNDVISKINLSKGASPSQFLPAFEAYKGSRELIYPDMYVKELSKLKVEVLNSVGGLDPNFGGALYTSWGSETCPGGSVKVPGTEGRMASTIKRSIGTTRFLCLTKNPEYISVDVDPNDEIRSFEELPEINEVAFQSRAKSQSQNQAQSVQCAKCRIPGKTTVTMLPGTNVCPRAEGSVWEKQYEGVLASTDLGSVRSELVCLQTSNRGEPIDTGDRYNILTETSMSGSHTSVACVVCSSKKTTGQRSSQLYLV